MEVGQADVAPAICITTLAGNIVGLKPPVLQHERVEELRPRIAKTLSINPGQVVIWSGETELVDGQTMQDLVACQQALALNVQILPCQLRPREYAEQIDNATTSFLEVSKIQYPRYHAVTFPEGTSHHDRYLKANEIGVLDPWDGNPGIGQANFPEPQDININMMPFILGDIQSLPEEYQHYWPLIKQCNVPEEEEGKVCYLTIQEGFVAAGQSQRRGGVHIESPGTMILGGQYKAQRYNWGCGAVLFDDSVVHGGIYMASNVPNSCRIWNLRVKEPERAVDSHGGLEHMRDILGEGTCMEANKIYWLTDATPHESLPLEKDTHRQFFRLVTSSLSVWYPEHSTANEKTKVDQSITAVLNGSKFA